MKFVFFGTPQVASDTLAYLSKEGLVPSLVVTNADAPRGRGQVMTMCETKAWALEHGLKTISPERLDEESIAQIIAEEADFAIVVAYGKMLPESLIQSFPKGVLNVHYSLLPKYRGASPVETALLNGETKTGVTIQRMVKEMDAGDIVAVAEEDILNDDTAVTLRARLIELGARLLVDRLPPYINGEIIPEPQDHALATYAPKLKKEDGQLDLSDDAKTNWNKYRAFAAWSGVYFFAGDKRVKITKASLSDDGEFIIERVVPEGKKEISYTQFTAS